MKVVLGNPSANMLAIIFETPTLYSRVWFQTLCGGSMELISQETSEGCNQTIPSQEAELGWRIDVGERVNEALDKIDGRILAR